MPPRKKVSIKDKDLEKYCKSAIKGGATHAKQIHPDSVVTAPWVPLKSSSAAPDTVKDIAARRIPRHPIRPETFSMRIIAPFCFISKSRICRKKKSFIANFLTCWWSWKGKCLRMDFIKHLSFWQARADSVKNALNWKAIPVNS